MKTFLYISFLIFISFNTIIYSQGYDPDDITGELVVQTFNSPSNKTITFRLNPMGFSSYCGEDSWVEHEILYDFRDANITGNLICDKPGFNTRGCNEYDSPIAVNCSGIMSSVSPLKLASYRVEILVNNVLKTYFYWDTRTTSYYVYNPEYYDCDPCLQYSNDFTIRYDVGNNVILIAKGVRIDPENQGPFFQARKGESYTVWDLNECESYCVDGFSPRPFSVLNIASSGGANPKPVLSWSAPEFSQYPFVRYEVQRSSNGQEFITIATINKIYVRSYIDNSVSWNPGDDNFIQYRIKNLFYAEGDDYFDYSNIQKIMVGNSQVEKPSYENLSDDNKNKFNLSQNYPNPFNPITKISYSIKEKDLVNIKVMNIIGEEIAVLVNEIKEKGIYFTEFNAEDLPSGVYFYTITTNGIKETRKMLLMK